MGAMSTYIWGELTHLNDSWVVHQVGLRIPHIFVELIDQWIPSGNQTRQWEVYCDANADFNAQIVNQCQSSIDGKTIHIRHESH